MRLWFEKAGLLSPEDKAIANFNEVFGNLNQNG